MELCFICGRKITDCPSIKRSTKPCPDCLAKLSVHMYTPPTNARYISKEEFENGTH